MTSISPGEQRRSRSVLIVVPAWPNGTMAIKFGSVMFCALQCSKENLRLVQFAPTRAFCAVTAVSEKDFRARLHRPGICHPAGIRFSELGDRGVIEDEIDWSEWALFDPVIATMIKLAIPITRENYLEIAYLEGLPEEWTAELETELPEPLKLRG